MSPNSVRLQPHTPRHPQIFAAHSMACDGILLTPCEFQLGPEFIPDSSKRAGILRQPGVARAPSAPRRRGPTRNDAETRPFRRHKSVNRCLTQYRPGCLTKRGGNIELRSCGRPTNPRNCWRTEEYPAGVDGALGGDLCAVMIGLAFAVNGQPTAYTSIAARVDVDGAHVDSSRDLGIGPCQGVGPASQPGPGGGAGHLAIRRLTLEEAAARAKVGWLWRSIVAMGTRLAPGAGGWSSSQSEILRRDARGFVASVLGSWMSFRCVRCLRLSPYTRRRGCLDVHNKVHEENAGQQSTAISTLIDCLGNAAPGGSHPVLHPRTRMRGPSRPRSRGQFNLT